MESRLGLHFTFNCNTDLCRSRSVVATDLCLSWHKDRALVVGQWGTGSVVASINRNYNGII